MADVAAGLRALRDRPRPATIAGGLLFVAGAVAAVTVHPAFVAVAATGAFGPALLRECRLLRDQDEFQARATASASSHGYLAGGLFVTAVLVARGWSRGARTEDPEAETWLMALSVMLAARFVSYAARFWDGQKAAFRTLVGFGTVWLVFVLVSHAGEPAALVTEIPVPLTLFLLAWASRRHPRAVGAILLALVAVGGSFGVALHLRRGRPLAAVPFVLFLLLPPTLAAIGLLRVKPDRQGDDD